MDTEAAVRGVKEKNNPISINHGIVSEEVIHGEIINEESNLNEKELKSLD